MVILVKMRTFTTLPNLPAAHRGSLNAYNGGLGPGHKLMFCSGALGGLRAIDVGQGLRDLYRGTMPALILGE